MLELAKDLRCVKKESLTSFHFSRMKTTITGCMIRPVIAVWLGPGFVLFLTLYKHY